MFVGTFSGDADLKVPKMSFQTGSGDGVSTCQKTVLIGWNAEALGGGVGEERPPAGLLKTF